MSKHYLPFPIRRTSRMAGLILLSVLIATTNQAMRVSAQPAVTWPTIALQETITSLSTPVALTNAGDGSGRIFVTEIAGRIRIFKNSSLLTTPFLDISSKVRSPASGGSPEEGLLSVAFPPNYASQGYFFVYYTRLDGDNQVSRFRVSGDPDLADANSEELVLLLPHPVQGNHNGGQLHFGKDSYLYISTGDGGGSGDPYNNGQNTNSLMGKILRIDVGAKTYTVPDGYYTLYIPFHPNSASATFPLYAIPANNPLVGQASVREEIWAYGLRNPWRFSFDRQTGDLYIGDVGQSSWEEVDFQAADSPGGENYGWKIMEGAHCYNSDTCDQTGKVLPIWEYSHSFGCSITGGYVYRGSAYPGLQGIYLASDYCSGRIWGLVREQDVWQNSMLLDSPYNVSSFGEDENGEIYLVALSGVVYKVVVP